VETPLAGFLADPRPTHRGSRDAAAAVRGKLHGRCKVAAPFVAPRLEEFGRPGGRLLASRAWGYDRFADGETQGTGKDGVAVSRP
jgi:hypothetical protein